MISLFAIRKTINTQPHNWLIHHIYVQSLKKFSNIITGNVLDIGCGQKPYKNIIEQHASNYFGLEYKKTLHGFKSVDVVGNAMVLPFKNSSADFIVSFQVMEHVPEPEFFLKELLRVLKFGGHLLLMTPFMWGEHEVPYDYYRYTRYGLEFLAKKTGFEVMSITSDTGFWATTIIRFNYFLMTYAKGPLRYIGIPIVWLDQFIALFLDKIFSSYNTETANYTTLLKKPSSNNH
jgi:SAM-dependent methyltransferase